MLGLVDVGSFFVPCIVLVAGDGVLTAVQNARGQGGVDFGHSQGSCGCPGVDHVDLDFGSFGTDLQSSEVFQRGSFGLGEHVTGGGQNVVVQGADFAAGLLNDLVSQSNAGIAVQVLQTAFNALHQEGQAHSGVLGDVDTTGGHVGGVDTDEVNSAQAEHFHGLSLGAQLAAAEDLDLNTAIGAGLDVVGKAAEHITDGAGIGVDFGEGQGQFGFVVGFDGCLGGGSVGSGGSVGCGSGFCCGGFGCATGSQGQNHGQSQQQSDQLLH